MNETNRENNQNVMDIVYQTASMGSYAIDQIFNAIENQKLTILVLKQKDKYDELMNRCRVLADKMVLEINDISMMLKASSFASIKVKSMMDDATSHLAEMLIQGTTMGITSLLEKRGENPNADEKIVAIATDLQTALEEFVDSLKTMLTAN